MTSFQGKGEMITYWLLGQTSIESTNEASTQTVSVNMLEGASSSSSEAAAAVPAVKDSITTRSRNNDTAARREARRAQLAQRPEQDIFDLILDIPNVKGGAV